MRSRNGILQMPRRAPRQRLPFRVFKLNGSGWVQVGAGCYEQMAAEKFAGQCAMESKGRVKVLDFYDREVAVWVNGRRIA